MKNIVQVRDDKLLVSIKDIAKFSGVEYESTQRLVRKSRDEFLELGLSIPKESDFKSVLFDEYQASFLITLMKNTPIVKRFKLDLVKQFKTLNLERCDNNKKVLESKQYQLKLSQKETEKAKRQKYATAGDDEFCNVHRFRIDHELDISDEELNNIFIDENILGQKLVNRYVPCPTGEFSKYDGTSVVLNIRKMLDICDKRNIKKIDEELNLFNMEQS